MNAPMLDEHLRMLRLPTMLAHYKRLAGASEATIAYLGELAAMEVEKRQNDKP